MNLDNQQLNALAPVERERYMELERLFASKGWRIFIATAKDNANAAYAVGANASTWEENRVAYGNRMAWQYVLALEEATEQEFEAKAARASHADELAAIAAEHELE